MLSSPTTQPIQGNTSLIKGADGTGQVLERGLEKTD